MCTRNTIKSSAGNTEACELCNDSTSVANEDHTACGK